MTDSTLATYDYNFGVADRLHDLNDELTKKALSCLNGEDADFEQFAYYCAQIDLISAIKDLNEQVLHDILAQS